MRTWPSKEEILKKAREREGLRRERTLTEQDVEIFLAAVQKYPASHVCVYAQRGAYVPAGRKWPEPMTLAEWLPRHAVAVVSECDARRPRAKGPWVTVDGKKEV